MEQWVNANMLKKELPTFDDDQNTHNRILDKATQLFALKGFKTVTLKDLAKAVGLKPPAIYNHYKDKETLIEDALSRFGLVYRGYHDWLSRANDKAETLENVMDNLFNRKFLSQLNPVSRLGMSMVLREQHNHKSAAQYAIKHLYKDGIRNIQTGFDNLIEKKVIPPSDTETLAILFMFCILSGNEVHLHSFAGTKVPVKCTKAYIGLRKLMTVALSQGLLEPKA
jgi:AcrR family transcriptional regulator